MPAALRRAEAGDSAGIRALLEGSALPVGDLGQARIEFLVAGPPDAILGVVGIEPFGASALLRSLAVAPTQRGAGLGQALVAAAEQLAREAGVDELVLLTTTAAPFFGRRGYREIPREAAPAPVRASAEFRSICPASATCMSKRLSQ